MIHQKIAIINWLCVINALQNAPFLKVTKRFMEDLEKNIETTVKTIIGLPHDAPNSML